MTTGTPRSRASWTWWSRRGAFVPVLWPKKNIMSQASKSSICTVPTGEPIDFGRPTEVDSWHMLEESGRFCEP